MLQKPLSLFDTVKEKRHFATLTELMELLINYVVQINTHVNALNLIKEIINQMRVTNPYCHLSYALSMYGEKEFLLEITARKGDNTFLERQLMLLHMSTEGKIESSSRMLPTPKEKPLTEVSSVIAFHEKEIAKKQPTYPTPDTFGAILEVVVTLDQPDDIIGDFGGIPPNTRYMRVSKDFVTGMVNYTRNHRAWLAGVHGVDEDVEMCDPSGPVFMGVTGFHQRLILAADLMRKDQAFVPARFDDTIVYGESNNSFYRFWFSKHVATSSILRVAKHTWPEMTYDDFCLLSTNHLLTNYHNWQQDHEQEEPILIEIKRKSWGWIG